MKKVTATIREAGEGGAVIAQSVPAWLDVTPGVRWSGRFRSRAQQAFIDGDRFLFETTCGLSGDILIPNPPLGPGEFEIAFLGTGPLHGWPI